MSERVYLFSLVTARDDRRFSVNGVTIATSLNEARGQLAARYLGEGSVVESMSVNQLADDVVRRIQSLIIPPEGGVDDGAQDASSGERE